MLDLARLFRRFAPVLLLAALVPVLAAPHVDAARARRKKPAVKRAPVGTLRLYLMEAEWPEGADAPPHWVPSTRIARLVDVHGGKAMSRPDSTGLATFTGMFAGRAIVRCWIDPPDSWGEESDTVVILAGRVITDTLWHPSRLAGSRADHARSGEAR